MSRFTQARKRVAPSELPEMLSLMRQSIDVLRLDLKGLKVVAPATTGFEAAIATLALLAGASKVTAITLPSNRYHSAEAAAETTLAIAATVNLAHRITVLERIDHGTCTQTNVLVNSAPTRPVTRSVIERLPKPAVVALMTEAWRASSREIDIQACHDHGVPIAAVNEMHEDVGGSEYRRLQCLKLLEQAGVWPADSQIALVCDNRFATNLESGLQRAGAHVVVLERAEHIFVAPWTAIVIALQAQERPRLGVRELATIAKAAPDAVVVQFWGDIDRTAARYFGLKVWPPRTPGKGQMGLDLEVLGPEPTIRLAAGALKAAELVISGVPLSTDSIAQILLADSGSRVGNL